MMIATQNLIKTKEPENGFFVTHGIIKFDVLS